MGKKLEFIFLFALLLLVGGIILGLLWRNHKLYDDLQKYKNAPADTVIVSHTDTITIDKPVEIDHYIKEKEYITVNDTTLIHDTLTQEIHLPKEVVIYGDSTYRAVVSGYHPSLDTLNIYQKTYIETITKTVTKTKKTHWGIGPQVGAGWNGKKVQPFVGVGVQFNIISW